MSVTRAPDERGAGKVQIVGTYSIMNTEEEKQKHAFTPPKLNYTGRHYYGVRKNRKTLVLLLLWVCKYRTVAGKKSREGGETAGAVAL